MGKGLGGRSQERVPRAIPRHMRAPVGDPGPCSPGLGGGGRARSDGPTRLPTAKPTPPVVSGPDNRTGPGQRVPFTCTAGGFFPEEIDVKWFKDKDRISVQPPSITLGQTKSSYDMSSTAVVTLQEDDVRSQLICEVQHSTLTAPLRGMYQLSKALRGEGWGSTGARGAQLLWGWGSQERERAPCGQQSQGMPGTRRCLSSQFPPKSAWSLACRAPLR